MGSARSGRVHSASAGMARQAASKAASNRSVLQCGVGGGAHEHHREVAGLVQEDQALVAVEVRHVGDRVHHGARLRSRPETVRAVDVRETAVAVELRVAALRVRPAEAPGPARGVHDEVGLDEGSVDPGADDPTAVEDEVVDVTRAQGEAGLVVRRVAKRSLERRSTREHPQHSARSVRARRFHGPGAQVEPAGVGLGPLRLEGRRHLGPESVGVLELHDATTDPGVSVRPGVPVHRRDPVTPAGEGGAEQEPRRARSHDECPHDPTSTTLAMI